jgi:putative transposase
MHEGWLHLAVVVDPFLRQVVGWSMGGRINNRLALWRRQLQGPVFVHPDEDLQLISHDWQDWQDSLIRHKLVSSLSRRGNCCDNAGAKGFFQPPKRGRIRQAGLHERQRCARRCLHRHEA